jgi:hypothetical protein
VIWVLVAVIVVLLVAVVVLGVRQQRSRRLQDRFGPEYTRVVNEQGDQRAAEKELAERRERHAEFDIRPLAREARQSYMDRWERTQRHFVDAPEGAVGDADSLVREAMQDRGYPVDDDFEQRAADLSVEHPVVVENYRAAHTISARARRGEASTEQLRQAMVHYRALFDDLLDVDPSASVQGRDSGAEVTSTPMRSR